MQIFPCNFCRVEVGNWRQRILTKLRTKAREENKAGAEKRVGKERVPGHFSKKMGIRLTTGTRFK